MKGKPHTLILAIIFLTTYLPTMSQTFTMGKKCKALLEEVNGFLDAESYTEALAKLDEFSGNCKTKDAKEIAATSKAEAYNGLQQYEQAIQEADAALKLTKDKSLLAHFQKGIALNELGDSEGSKSELQKVIELTEMNQNSSVRANNYALMARIYSRQLNDRDSADIFLDKAIELNPGNTAYIIQRGDMNLYYNEYEKAYANYDEALSKGHDPLDVSISRTKVSFKKLENKYGTNKANELRNKMTSDEKEVLCSDLSKALNLGWEDMSMDMFSALVCN